ncbi:primosomal protein N', partial [Actinomyces sp. MRS3W]|nr:primosomal protein N' [Actinomyces sp. MRS3W]
MTEPGVSHPVARILLETAVPHLDRLFDYLVPPELDVAAGVGTRVVVRFGAQDLHGWIWERAATTTHPGRLAPIRRVVSDLPVLSVDTMRLVEAVAARTAGTRSDVVRLAVPARHATTERAERDRPIPTP